MNIIEYNMMLIRVNLIKSIVVLYITDIYNDIYSDK